MKTEQAIAFVKQVAALELFEESDAERDEDNADGVSYEWLTSNHEALEGLILKARELVDIETPEASAVTTIPASYPWIKANARAEKWSDVTLAVVLSHAHSEKAPEDAYAWEPDRNIEGALKHSNFYWQTMSKLRLNVCLAHNWLRLAKLEAAYQELGFDLQEASAGEVCFAEHYGAAEGTA